MNWLYSLSIECGGEPGDADMLVRHFRDLVLSLSHGVMVAVDVSRTEDGWVIVSPQGLSHSGIQSDSDARDMSRAGDGLIQHLRTVKGYRYALLGVDSAGFIDYCDIDKHYAGDGFSGLIVSDSIWTQLGKPKTYRRFVPGYHWQPYQGERYEVFEGEAF